MRYIWLPFHHDLYWWAYAEYFSWLIVNSVTINELHLFTFLLCPLLINFRRILLLIESVSSLYCIFRWSMSSGSVWRYKIATVSSVSGLNVWASLAISLLSTWGGNCKINEFHTETIENINVFLGNSLPMVVHEEIDLEAENTKEDICIRNNSVQLFSK